MKELTLADAISLGTASAFVLTVLYVFGLSRPLDVDLFVYLGLDDYLTLAIRWLTPVVVTGFLGSIGPLISQRLTADLKSEDPKGRAETPVAPRVRAALETVALVAFILSTLLLYVFASSLAGASAAKATLVRGAVGTSVWLFFASWFLSRQPAGREWPQQIGLLFLLLPALGVFSYHYGEYSSRIVFEEHGKAITVRVDDSPDHVSGRMLIATETYLLLLTGDQQKVIAIPKAKVKSIEETVRPGPQTTAKPPGK